MELTAFSTLTGNFHLRAHSLINRVAYFDELHALRLGRDSVDASLLDKNDTGMALRFLTEGEIRAFARQPESGLQGNYLEEAIRRGDRCLAVLDGDRLASYSWYATKPTRVTGEFRVVFDPRYVYMHHCYTAEAYRGKRLNVLGMAGGFSTVVAEGYEGLVCIVARTNKSSLKSTKRLGYREFGRIYVGGAVNRYFAYINRGCRRAGFGVERARADLHAWIF